MRKNIFLILSFILAALLFTACTIQAKVYVCPDGKEVSMISQCTAPIEEPEEKLPEPNAEQDVPTFLKDLSPDVQVFFDKSKNTKTIKFNYFRSDNPYTQNAYYASEQLLKVELFKDEYGADEPYDVIYLNTSSMQATAYCELADKETCLDKDKPYEVDFEKYHITTPYEWMGLVRQAEVTGRSKQFDGRQVKELKFETLKGEGTMWVDSFFGLPIEVNYEDVTYRFENAVINIVDEKRLTH